MRIFPFFVLVLFSFGGIAQSIFSASYNGKLIDASSKKGIPFASIKIINTTLGTATNLEGYFLIDLDYHTQLLISCIGYKSLIIKTKDLKSKSVNIISLQPQTYELEEVVVESERIPIEHILTKVVNEIEKNYYQTEFSFDIFVNRELRDFANNDPILTQMMVAEGYYGQGYGKRKNAHSSRYELNYNISHQKIDGDEYKYLNYDYGVFTGYGLIILDIIRHKNCPLNKSNFKDFDFRIDNVSIHENDSIYSIPFASKTASYTTSGVMAAKEYTGVIYISLPKYVVVQFEGSILLDKENRFNDNRNFSDDPQLSFTVNYDRVGGKYAFSYMKSSMVIYERNNKLRFDQAFFPYNFNFVTPKKLTGTHLEKESEKNNLEFWNAYRKPKNRIIRMYRGDY